MRNLGGIGLLNPIDQAIIPRVSDLYRVLKTDQIVLSINSTIEATDFL